VRNALSPLGIGAQKLDTIESHPPRLHEDTQQPDMMGASPPSSLRICLLGGSGVLARASAVLAAVLRVGWGVIRQRSSQRTLARGGRAKFTFAFYDREEIGPKMLAWLAVSKRDSTRGRPSAVQQEVAADNGPSSLQSGGLAA
jgi:hypothetical protein